MVNATLLGIMHTMVARHTHVHIILCMSTVLPKGVSQVVSFYTTSHSMRFSEITVVTKGCKHPF